MKRDSWLLTGLHQTWNFKHFGHYGGWQLGSGVPTSPTCLGAFQPGRHLGGDQHHSQLHSTNSLRTALYADFSFTHRKHSRTLKWLNVSTSDELASSWQATFYSQRQATSFLLRIRGHTQFLLEKLNAVFASRECVVRGLQCWNSLERSRFYSRCRDTWTALNTQWNSSNFPHRPSPPSPPPLSCPSLHGDHALKVFTLGKCRGGKKCPSHNLV